MNLAKKYIEKKYNCILTRTSGFDDNRLFWTVHKNDDGELGEYLADGWTLKEIESKLLIKKTNTEFINKYD